MKASILTLTGILLASATAQEPNDAATPTRPPQHQKDRDPRRGGDFWKKADTNGDQLISREEFLALPRIAKLPEEKQTKLFSRLDKNGNGTLEGPELRPAHPPQGPKDGDQRGGMRGRIMPRIAELDLDQDRKISFEEFTQAPMIAKLPAERQRKMFDNMDRNGDGFLSPEDRPAQGPGPRGDGPPMGPKVFERLDANKDQVLDFSEFQKFPPVAQLSEDEQEDRFQKIDANADGKIDVPEWKKHLQAMANQVRKPQRPEGSRKAPKPKPQPDAESDSMEEME
jgi:Ca2+-binding EF-hand superfamily protein